MRDKINIIDCTLRDGGYYNNWDFSNKLVNDYLKSISETGIRYVELGFRSLSKKEFKGPNWYTTDSYINHLTIPKKLKIGQKNVGPRPPPKKKKKKNFKKNHDPI